MKRVVSMACVFLVTAAVPAWAQVDVEDVRRLHGTVESLTEGQESLRRQIQELRDVVSELRQENSRLKQQLSSGGEMVNREQLKEVIKSIKQVDEKRAADADYVKRQLEEIAKEVSKSLSAPPPQRETPKPTKPAPVPHDPPPNLPEKQYVHKVGTGETLGAIIAAYNKEYSLKVKVSDVLAANPNLKDAKRLRVGQELNIPAVK
jgi:TolA-binding protein